MNDWSAGYVDDISYTYGYYKELNPLWLRLAFLNKGLQAPKVKSACELGYGQGVSINLHAAGSDVEWHGTDFLPAQASFAQELAAVCASGAQLTDESFEQYALRDDLPMFDFIALHGIWSWVSAENRQHIVNFLKARLAVGGVLYISYNTQPGWASFAPIRHLMSQHSDLMSGKALGTIKKVGGAVDFISQMIKTKPGFVNAVPNAQKRFDKISKQSPDYLAHEYFNRSWTPMYFSEVAEALQEAKLQFACSATLMDHIDSLNLTPEQQSFLRDIPDEHFKEGVRDLMVNQMFRRDFWVKGLRTIPTAEAISQVREQRVVLVASAPNGPLKITANLGEAEADPAIYKPIFDVMNDFQPRSIGEIEKSVVQKGLNFGKLMQAILVLAHSSYLQQAQDEKTIAKQKEKTDKLNRAILLKSRNAEQINYLVSPVTGGGIKAPRFMQLFMLATHEGMNNEEQLARYVSTILAQQGQKITREGKLLETEAEILADLSRSAKDFLNSQLPILKALKVI
ncbi:MAG: class I SAM-dependent methyltransferase [Pseudohongiellaceae bacterium]|nr:class I SAM-dependent methyltransferase [Pseudohongiellaceae bacterium]